MNNIDELNISDSESQVSNNELNISESQVSNNDHVSVFDLIDPVYNRGYTIFKFVANEKDLTSFPYDLINFPEDVCNFTKLSLLDLMENQITEIPPDIGKLKYLKNMYLGFNCIEEITPELCNLNLKRLELGWNAISIIPPEISNLKNLTRLCLNNNSITTIPSELFKLVNLRELYLSDNKITEIPSELCQLNKLNCLDLTHNRITKVKFDKSITNFLSKIYELKIDMTSYDMKNLVIDCNMLIFTRIYNNLKNLPANLKTICFSEKVENHYTSKNIDNIKENNIIIDLPVGCEIIFF